VAGYGGERLGMVRFGAVGSGKVWHETHVDVKVCVGYLMWYGEVG